MATLTVQEVSLTGDDITTSAAAGGGDRVSNDGKISLKVVNGHSGAQTVTIARNRKCNQGFQHDVAIAVGAGETAYIGPFPRDEFASIIDITYSGVTSLTIGAFRVGD